MITGCTKYQYATVSSEFYSSATKGHIIENDTLALTYKFAGEGGPVQITLQNKLNKPLYIDWRKSAIIINGVSITYWQDKSILDGSLNGANIQLTDEFSQSFSTISGKITRPESSTFIPPQSSITNSFRILKNSFFTLEGDKKSHRQNVYTSGGRVNSLVYEYTKENSPLLARSFLTLSTDPSFHQSFTLDHPFWISKVVQTSANPTVYLDSNVSQFHTEKTTATGGIISVVVFLGVLIILAL